MFLARFSILLLLGFCLAVTGCGASEGQGLLGWMELRNPAADDDASKEVVHPEGEIARPNVPDELKEQARAGEERLLASGNGNGVRIRYQLRVASPGDKAVAEAFEDISLLERLRDIRLDSVNMLEQRLATDLDTAREVLHAHAYYDGDVSGSITETGTNGDNGNSGGQTANGKNGSTYRNYLVEVNFNCGPQYVLGTSKVIVAFDEDGRGRELADALPAKLDDVGYAAGSPAIADTMLNAVDRVREVFRNKGYPWAAVSGTKFMLDRELKTIDAEVRIKAGKFVYMGPLQIEGELTVRERYLEFLRTWKDGDVWNQSKVEQYREALRQTGLFAMTDLSPADEDNEDGQRPVRLNIAPGPERTVGGALRYNSDFGAGILGYWEHRNITGRGDKLRIEAPVWEDMQELVFSYRQPFFQRADQDLLLQAGGLHQTTDAYEISSGMASAGLERRLAKRWSGTLRVSGEGGQLKDPDESEKSYYMLGLPASLTFNDTNNPLDATQGVRLTLAASPYFGRYGEDFTVLRTRFDARAFWDVLDDASWVLALRGSYGALIGEDAGEVPATIRFYSGGGGSVRGYAYQSLGPRTAKRDPLGGASLLEVNVESRLRFSESWGLVTFLDGGRVYEHADPDFGKELFWGAGLGVRYYTVIGPVRMDVAFPLNPRSDDGSVQLYISIGQSF